MSERTVRHGEDHELEFVDGPELDEYLDSIVSSIGWVVVYFNSLEDHISDFIREVVLRDPYQDERLEPFLCEMGFSAKSRALIQLYGQMISAQQIKCTHDDLGAVESMLNECASRRNEYAHGDWIGVRKERFGSSEVTFQEDRSDSPISKIRYRSIERGHRFHQRRSFSPE